MEWEREGKEVVREIEAGEGGSEGDREGKEVGRKGE